MYIFIAPYPQVMKRFRTGSFQRTRFYTPQGHIVSVAAIGAIISRPGNESKASYPRTQTRMALAGLELGPCHTQVRFLTAAPSSIPYTVAADIISAHLTLDS